MSRRILTAVVVGLLYLVPGYGQEKEADPLPALLAKLRQPINLGNPGTETSLRDFAEAASAKLGVPVLLNDAAFENGQAGFSSQFKFKLSSNKLPLARLLPSIPGGERLTLLIRADHVLITPESDAAREAQIPNDGDSVSGIRLQVPLVSLVVQDKPLAETLSDLARIHDATIILPPQTIGSRDVAVSARMLNVPLNRALELLATQADLRVVAKGNAFLVTTRDHANQLADDEREKAERQAELERIKSGAPAPPPPPPPPAPDAGEKKDKLKDEKKD